VSDESRSNAGKDLEVFDSSLPSDEANFSQNAAVSAYSAVITMQATEFARQSSTAMM
jgi:hypothetical protein